MKFSILFSLLIPTLFYAQIGVNTVKPEQLVHIHGKTTSSVEDDVVITDLGKVGIGTINPTAKLEIVTTGTFSSPQKGFKLVDGTQTDTYVLTSDANGFGNWQPIDITVFKFKLTGSPVLLKDKNDLFYLNNYIDIPPGTWMINFTIGMQLTTTPTYNRYGTFIRLRLLDDPNPTNLKTDGWNVSNDAIAPKLASTGFPTNLEKGTFVGSLAIDNKTANTKRYYLFADNSASGHEVDATFLFGWNESYFSFFRIDDRDAP